MKIFQNILKYTIGLPFLLFISIAYLFYAPAILAFEILGKCVILLIEGNCRFNDFCGIGLLQQLCEIWEPIK